MPESNEQVTPVSGNEPPEPKVSSDKTENLSEIVNSQIEGLEGKLNKSITGAVKRNLADAFKSKEFNEALYGHINTAVKEASAPPSPPETDVDMLKSQIGVLEGRLNDESEARSQAEKKASDQALKTGIGNLVNSLDGSDGKPKISANARNDLTTLLEGGHRLNGKPELNDQGDIVVTDHLSGETKPLAAILSNGYFGDNHWARERYTATGSGAGRGAANSAPATTGIENLSSSEGRQAFTELAEKDADAAIAEAHRHQQESMQRMQGKRRR